MIIEQLDIERFGRWKHVRFSNLTAGVNLFYGPNEAGKTTLKQFVRYILFGSSPELETYLLYSDAKKSGGKISVQHLSGKYSVARSPSMTQNGKDTLTICDSAKRRLENRLLDSLLSNNQGLEPFEECTEINHILEVDEELYFSVFAIGLQELQALSSLTSPQLATLLYRLSTGLHRNALQNTLDSLRHEMDGLLHAHDSTDLLESADFLQILARKTKHISGDIVTGLVGATASSGWILQQMMKREIILRQINDAKNDQSNYARLSHDYFELKNDMGAVQNIQEQISHQKKVLLMASAIRDKWEKREDLDKQIVEFRNSHSNLSDEHEGNVFTPEQALERAENLKQRDEKLLQDERRCRRRLSSLTEEIRAVHFLPEMLGLLPRMEVALIQEERVQQLAARIASLDELRATTISELEIGYQRLGLACPNFIDASCDDEIRRLEKTGDLTALRIPARDYRRGIRKLKSANAEKKERLSEISRLRRQLEAYYRGAQGRLCAVNPKMTDLFSRNHSPDLTFVDVLSSAIGEESARYRRQILYFDKLKQMAEDVPPAECACAEARARLVTPKNELVVSGTLFTLGLTLAIYAFVALFSVAWSAYPLYFAMFLLGNAAWISVFTWKLRKEKRFESEYRQKTASLVNLRSEIQTTLQGAGIFAAIMPSEMTENGWSGENEENFLDAIIEICRAESERVRNVADVYQKEIFLLEEQSLAAAKCRVLMEDASYLRKTIHKYNRQLQESRKSYASILEQIGLPGNWKPVNVRNYRRNIPRLQELWRRLQRDEEDLSRYESEFRIFTQKMREIMDEISKIAGISAIEMRANVKNDDETAFSSACFPILREKMHEQVQAREEKTRLRLEMKKVRKKLAATLAMREKVSARRQAILKRFSVKNEDALRDKLESLRKLQELYVQRQAIQRDIDTEINFLCEETAIWEVYQKYTPPQLASRIQLIEQRLAMSADDLNAKNERLSEISERLRELEQDRSLPVLHFELTKIEQNILSGIRQWRTLGVTHRLIEAVKKTYEQKRQPETLNSASIFLSRLTGGKYVRVWTPVDEDVLRVDREDGQVFAPEQLSTGTCETLFLALRLALIEGFRRQNLRLPVFFDDILVNFDKKRLTLAVEVLCEFFRPDERTPAGEQPQIFVFTCHEHIKEIFVQHGVNLCEMGQ